MLINIPDANNYKVSYCYRCCHITIIAGNYIILIVNWFPFMKSIIVF